MKIRRFLIMFTALLSTTIVATAATVSDSELAFARQTPQIYTYNTAEGKAEIENPKNGYLDTTRNWQGIPGIECVESNGRLWATWFSGGVHETKDNYVILVTSSDGGETWSDARVIIDPDKTGPVRAFDPVLWMDPNGKMWILWNQQYTTGGAWKKLDGKQGVWGMYTEDASIEDPVWSEPVRLCNNVCMHKPAVTSHGWLLPAYCVNRGMTEETAENEKGACLYRFVDYGKPWERFGQIGGELLPDLDAFIEHGVVERENGDLFVVLRSNNGMLYSLSTDGGKTWSAGMQMTDNGAVMSKVVSRNHIKRLASGALLLLYHDNNTANTRNNLTAALSFDDGATWPYKLLLDARTGVSYPDATQTADGKIYITYDFSRFNAQQILMSVITEEDIKAGKLVSEGSALKKLINNNGTYYAIVGYEAPLENLAHLSVAEETGEVAKLRLGERMFTDRTYEIIKMPTLFCGHSFVRSSIGSVSATVTKAGNVYVLTPEPGKSVSQQEVLRTQGFRPVMPDTLPLKLFVGLAEELVLMKKTCTVGEQLTIGKYAILLTDICESGDVNEDGAADLQDVLLALHNYLQEKDMLHSDVNGDGKLTLLDILQMLKKSV